MAWKLLIVLALCSLCNVSCAAQQSSLRHVADVPLPGSATRFDYESLDPHSGLLYVDHMGAGRLIIFDTRTRHPVANLPGFADATGNLVVPDRHRVYVSAPGSWSNPQGQIVALDTRMQRIVARIPGGGFPDGMAYDPVEQRLFVSDERGETITVIDTRTDHRIAILPMGGQVGNTQYDPRSGLIYANVQTRNQLVAIDPRRMRIVARYPLSRGQHPHGLLIDGSRQLAFIACDHDARLLVFNLRTHQVTASYRLGRDPDVLSFDPGEKRLYVASESGVVAMFAEQGNRLQPLGRQFVAPYAHVIAVDPRTHLLYLPLQDLHGRPMMRIMRLTGHALSG